MPTYQDGLEDGVGCIEDRGQVGQVAHEGLGLGEELLLELVVSLQDLEGGWFERPGSRLLVDLVRDVLDCHVEVDDVVLAIGDLRLQLPHIGVFEEDLKPLAEGLELLRSGCVPQQLVDVPTEGSLVLSRGEVELARVHRGLWVDFAGAVEPEELVTVCGGLWLRVLVSEQLLEDLWGREKQRHCQRLVGRIHDPDATRLVSADLDQVEVDGLGNPLGGLRGHEWPALLGADGDRDVGEDVGLDGQGGHDLALEGEPLGLPLLEQLQVLGRD